MAVIRRPPDIETHLVENINDLPATFRSLYKKGESFFFVVTFEPGLVQIFHTADIKVPLKISRTTKNGDEKIDLSLLFFSRSKEEEKVKTVNQIIY